MSELNDVKLRILAKVDLSQLIGERIKLERRSGKMFGLCPFHNEKTPSFTIYQDHYHCFGCKASGDAIDYVRHTHGLKFVEALKYLAQKFGVDASELERNSKWKDEGRKLSVLYKHMSAAQTWFVAQLNRPENLKILQYLRGRGFSDENIKDFGFGYAPDHFQMFIDAMKRHGANDQQLIDCSLARKSQNPRQHDSRSYAFFRDRLMVPIHDSFGRVIAFGGRTMSDNQAKYMNSSQTYLFDKSKVLFGLHKAKESIREKGYAVIVEGYMDVLQLWQNGFRNAVACMGTALTIDQLQTLSHFTKRIVLCFDGDQAGRMATLSSVESALNVPKVAIKVISLPEGEDPDSYVTSKGPEGFVTAIDEAEDLLSFAIRSKIDDSHGLDLPVIVRKELIPWIAKISDRMQRSFLISRVSQLTGLPESDLRIELQQSLMPNLNKGAQAIQPVSRADKKSKRILGRAQFEFLGHIFFSHSGDFDPDQVEQILDQHLEFGDIWQTFAEDMIMTLRDKKIGPHEENISSWPSATDPLVTKCIDRFYELKNAFVVEDRFGALQKIASKHKLQSQKKAIDSLKAQLKTANPDQQLELLSAIQELQKSAHT